jgi:dUTP pyrophosphatase
MTDIVLKLYVDKEMPKLREQYKKAVVAHNQKMKDDFPDAGFDLFVPESFTIPAHKSLEKVNLHVKGAMFGCALPLSYFTYPRSSIYKLPLRLANSVGIIDSGYRGNLMAMFDNHGNSENKEIKIEQYQRLIQICGPNLTSFLVELVENEEDLGLTDRGSGGFGSTGV